MMMSIETLELLFLNVLMWFLILGLGFIVLLGITFVISNIIRDFRKLKNNKIKGGEDK